MHYFVYNYICIISVLYEIIILNYLQNGVIFAPLTVMPWLIFSGFFLHLSDAPVWLQWLFHLSFLKYGLEGLMMAVYGYNRPNIPCSDDYCHFISPRKFLQELDLEKADYWTDFYVLFSLYIVIKAVTYFVLHYQVCHKQWFFQSQLTATTSFMLKSKMNVKCWQYICKNVYYVNSFCTSIKPYTK